MKIKTVTPLLAMCTLSSTLCACAPVAQQATQIYSGQVNPSSYSSTYKSKTMSDKLYGNDIKTLRTKSNEVIEGEVQSLSYVKDGALAYTIAEVKTTKSLKDDGTLDAGDVVHVLYMGGYIPLADVVSADDSVSHSFDAWSEEDIDKTVVYQEPMGEELPEVGDKAVYFLMEETNFPQWGKTYSLVSGTASELGSSDNGESFEYMQEGSNASTQAYSTAAIEMAVNDNISFQSAQAKLKAVKQ